MVVIKTLASIEDALRGAVKCVCCSSRVTGVEGAQTLNIAKVTEEWGMRDVLRGELCARLK